MKKEDLEEEYYKANDSLIENWNKIEQLEIRISRLKEDNKMIEKRLASLDFQIRNYEEGKSDLGN